MSDQLRKPIMAEKDALLIELGVEELPAGSVKPLSEFLASELQRSLESVGMAGQAPKVFATPRRIAALFDGVAAKQPDREIQKRGPAIKAAFDESGLPTKALQGFARSCGADIDKLERLETDKGSWMVFNTTETGQALSDVLSDVLPQVIKQMPMPKRMRWSDRSDEFLRPVQWLLGLYGTNIVDLSVLGLSADRLTYGHRFHSPAAISLKAVSDYESLLREASVIASFEDRRKLIEQQVNDAASQAGAQVEINPELLDEVTALVEWPVAIAGSFEPEFLELPKEALIQTMEENQRYFAMLDKNGELLPGFVTVANIVSSNPNSVKEGNERVIRPRFKDTMFFWESDCAKPFAEFRPDLERVLFQEKLGSVLDKTERLATLATKIAPSINAEADECRQAAMLCKCDLVTATVTELAKMQGIAGRYLAARENYSESFCAAMEEQYWPKSAGGQLPLSKTGQVLSIAEKLDTLTGIYGIGLKPSGTRDPFGLRRASVGLLRLLIECEIDVDLRDLIDVSQKSFGAKLDADFNPDELVDYILERLKGYYQEHGVSADVVDAVLVLGVSNPLDIHQRVTAVASFRSSDAAASLAAANKRIRNILKKAEKSVPTVVNESLLEDAAEQALATSLTNLESEIEPLFSDGNYHAAMTSTAKLRQPVDDFFNDVMVMVEDENLRTNRLALLSRVGKLCSRTADLSKLQVETVS